MLVNIVISLVFLQGCVTGGSGLPGDPSINHAVVEVYYATDRNLQSIEKIHGSPILFLEFPSENEEQPRRGYAEQFLAVNSDRRFEKAIYGGSRSEVSYGVSKVSIPRDFRLGRLERASVLRFELREDPDRQIIQLDAEPLSKDEFFKNLNTDISMKTNASKNDAFVFIHGRDVTFEDAAKRTAQMKYDLAFPGVAVFYSWPSKGALSTYSDDEKNIEWATSNFRSFLHGLFLNSNAEQLYLIAHGMGSRALTKAITQILDDKPEYKNRIGEIVFAVPDIDADVFERSIAPDLVSSRTPVTLYSSSKDKVLAESKKMHSYIRAGESGENIMIISGVETIDCSEVDTSFIGHSFYAESQSVISDLFYLMHDKRRAYERVGLIGIESDDGRYWKFRE